MTLCILVVIYVFQKFYMFSRMLNPVLRSSNNDANWATLRPRITGFLLFTTVTFSLLGSIFVVVNLYFCGGN